MASATETRPRRGRFFLLYWLPVLLWLLVIFSFSTDAGSSRRTSRFIGPILRWIYPGASDEAVHAIQLGIRKGAHLTEYAILALLVWRAVRRSGGPLERRPWSARHALIAITFAALFAITDEWHQSTIPSRQGQLTDVLIDTTGAVGAMVLAWAIGRRKKLW
jgi:VanZ family protein